MGNDLSPRTMYSNISGDENLPVTIHKYGINVIGVGEGGRGPQSWSVLITGHDIRVTVPANIVWEKRGGTFLTVRTTC